MEQEAPTPQTAPTSIPANGPVDDGVQTASNTSSAQHDDAASFSATWDTSDSSALLPLHLARARVPRAWERKPQSPFSRRRLKVGKVWKRTSSNVAALPAFAASQIHAHVSAMPASPAKVVKKLRFESSFGVGAQVSNWEPRGSPVARRRIVTRSTATSGGTEELLALPEEEAEEKEDSGATQEDVTVEVIHEDGTVEASTVEDTAGGESNEWSDVVDEEDHTAFDDTMMHLVDIVEPSNQEVTDSQETAATEGKEETKHREIEVVEEDTSTATANLPEAVGLATVDAREHNSEQASTPIDVLPQVVGELVRRVKSPMKNVVLPQGFISPAAARSRRSIKHARLSNASRRRTLPVNFVATVLPDQHSESTATAGEFANPDAENAAYVQNEDCASEPEASQDENADAQSMDDEEPAVVVPEDPASSNEDEWEDIESEVIANDALDIGITRPESAVDAQFEIVEPNLIEEPTASADKPAGGPNKHASVSRLMSTRRQSSSPMKQSSIWPLSDRSHLVAFTPVKRPFSFLPPIHLDDASCSPVTGTVVQSTDTSSDAGVPTITRSSSAPPEEPHMSPQKPRQPRISDDTALLQAFLNRAAESKTSRRMSEAARRESLENRRNSDSVRRALASADAAPAPVPPTVLVDLDPNSPSPRKASVTVVLEHLPATTKQDEAVEEDDLTPTSPQQRPNSRRSGRVKKKTETLAATTYTAPNKISIRGNAESVVLKRSEAQELALQTRNNTRKNKGGSVLPPLRLTRLGKETPASNCGDTLADPAQPANAGAKVVQWAETLTATHHYTVDADDSAIDESNDAIVAPAPLNSDEDMAKVATAAATVGDVSSEPKPRRPKPPRTEAMPAKVSFDQASTGQAAADATSAPAASTAVKPRTRKLRSRIATPAKAHGVSLLSLPDEVEEHPAALPHAAAQRKAVSRLPAPSSSAVPSGAAKESSLIASPPKKRLRQVSSSVVSKLRNGQASSRVSSSKLDLANPTISFNPRPQTEDVEDAPGLASPAKKPSGVFLFGGDGSAAAAESRQTDELPVPGLGSPAKKRTRRIVR